MTGLGVETGVGRRPGFDAASPANPPVDCHADPVTGARRLAEAFDAGRRLVVLAPDRSDHGHHVAVEFLHPVVTGSAALPAVALATSAARRPGDVVLVIGDPGGLDAVDLVVPPVGEAETMVAYHLLWELVQLALSSAASDGGDSTDFLYPFLDGTESKSDEHLRSSAEAKAAESRETSVQAVAANAERLSIVASLIQSAVAAGGRVLTMGNGGSACDAARAERLLTAVGAEAQALTGDYAVITALANDLGIDRVFARQVTALGRPGDILIGFSTSGTSANLLAAFDEARHRGLHTVGFAGYDGTGFATHPSIDHTLAVASQSVHRIQEAQAVLLDAVVERLAERLNAGFAGGGSTP